MEHAMIFLALLFLLGLMYDSSAKPFHFRYRPSRPPSGGEFLNEDRVILQLFAIFPTNGSLFHREALVRPALDFAKDYINNRSSAGGNYPWLSLEYTNTDLFSCEIIDTIGVYQMIADFSGDLLRAECTGGALVPLAFFGPGCPKGLEDLAKWQNATYELPIFDAVAPSRNLGNKTNGYPNLINTGHTEHRFSTFYQKIIERFDWKHVTLLVDNTDSLWREMSASVKAKYPEFPVKNICGPDVGANDSVLTNILHEATALIFFAHMECVKSILLEAVHLNLTSPANDTTKQLTFIVTNLFDSKYWGTLNLTQNTYNKDGGAFRQNITAEDRESLETAYSQTFVASYYITPELQEKMQNLTQMLIHYVNFNNRTYNQPKFLDALTMEGVNPAMLGYYSSLHIFAQALTKVRQLAGLNATTTFVQANASQQNMMSDGTNIVRIIQEQKHFDIPFVGSLQLDENGDKLGCFALKRYDEDEGTFVNWLSLSDNDTKFVDRSDGFEYYAEITPIKWPTIKPTDGPTPPPTAPEIIGLAAAVVLIFVASGIVIKCYVNKARLGNKWWVIDPDSLKYLQGREADRISSGNPHDTQTVKSEAFTCLTVYDEDNERNFQLARYHSQIVTVQTLKKRWSLSQSLLLELRQVRMHSSHTNLLKFYGICVQNSIATIVTEFAARGSLADLFLGPQAELDWSLRYSLLYDLLEGMIFIHKSFGFHGHLTSLNCMIDRTFVLKVRDYAPKCLLGRISEMNPWELLWTAPEMLKNPDKMPTMFECQKADIFSIGIILQEIIMECVPYPGSNKESFIYPPPEIIKMVKDSSINPPYRPLVPHGSICDSRFRDIMEDCWTELPESRPALVVLKNRLREIRGHNVKGNLFDDLMERLQSYAGQLQQAVEERTQQLREEQQKIQDLLYELLPKSVADKLISKRPVDPEPFDCVTIYFSDIVSFTTIAAESTAAEVVNMLNHLYHLFDGIIDNYDAYKVETIGDAYMVVSGLPKRNGTNHAPLISKLSLNILQAAGNFQIPHRPHDKFKMRIGIHSGACVAGVVGNKMPRYCLFGDTVNTASRMESTSEPNRVQLSATTARLITGNGEFHLESRGVIEVKGKGAMETFWLTPGSLLTSYPTPSVQTLGYMRKGTNSMLRQNSLSNTLNSSFISSVRNHRPIH